MSKLIQRNHAYIPDWELEELTYQHLLDLLYLHYQTVPEEYRESSTYSIHYEEGYDGVPDLGIQISYESPATTVEETLDTLSLNQKRNNLLAQLKEIDKELGNE